ncbi:hypothetical protein MLD52_17735 [Puniceicoccaceae bacterium K14]|nr:hypothetical protein [Puniceicoccaceae bacterium K14]
MLKTFSFSYLSLFCVSFVGGANLTLEVAHEADENPLVLEDIRYTASDGTAYGVARLSYLLSDFDLRTKDGEWIGMPEWYAWMDVGEGRQEVVLPNIPPRLYQKIRFNLGLAPKANHSDPTQYDAEHPLNSNLNQLHWTWKDGYIFMALEGHYDQDGENAGFVYHLANDWNLVPVEFEVEIDLNGNAALELVLDVERIMSSTQPLSFEMDGDSTHAGVDDPLAAKLKANLSKAFRVSKVTSASEKVSVAMRQPIDKPSTFTPYHLPLGYGFPIPKIPADNPLFVERIELGEKLFFDKILSADKTISCADCHNPELGFSDPNRLSSGINGSKTRRHSMALINLAWKDSFFWDGRVKTLREQVVHPITDPAEMGADLDVLVEKLKESDDYVEAFGKAFASGEISVLNLSLALENYLLTLTSNRSRFDLSRKKKLELTEQEKRGFELFMMENEPRNERFGADCFHCHGGALFTDHAFHDNGLDILEDLGRMEATGRRSDKGKFVTPTLRNVELTAPYMHDGRFGTLEEVVAHYNAPMERRATLDSNLAKHPKEGLNLSADDQAALVAFLKALTEVPVEVNETK